MPFVFVAAVSSTPPSSPLSDFAANYPPWVVVVCVTLAAAAGIWVLAKLLKWTLWLLMIAVLVVGGTVAVRMLIGS